MFFPANRSHVNKMFGCSFIHSFILSLFLLLPSLLRVPRTSTSIVDKIRSFGFNFCPDCVFTERLCIKNSVRINCEKENPNVECSLRTEATIHSQFLRTPFRDMHIDSCDYTEMMLHHKKECL
jgi:hypothetical protein